MDTFPIGIDFLDALHPEGQREAGVYGLLGPIGVGKTTLATMIAVEHARRSQALGKSLFVTIEMTHDDIWRMTRSYGGRVTRATVERACTLGEAAKHPSFQHVRLMSQEVTDLARFGEANANLNQSLQIIDLHSEGFSRAPDPVSLIEKQLELACLDGPVRAVVIDYAGIAVKRFCGTHNLDVRSESRLLSNFVQRSRKQIAESFNCPVWIVQQLNGTANKLAPLQRQTHEMASACRNFGDHFDACFVLGTVHEQLKCFSILRSKPAVDTVDASFTWLRVNDHIAKLDVVPNVKVDRVSRRIFQKPQFSIDLDSETHAEIQEFVEKRNASDLTNRD